MCKKIPTPPSPHPWQPNVHLYQIIFPYICLRKISFGISDTCFHSPILFIVKVDDEKSTTQREE